MYRVLLRALLLAPAVQNVFDFHSRSFLVPGLEDANLWEFEELFQLLQIR